LPVGERHRAAGKASNREDGQRQGFLHLSPFPSDDEIGHIRILTAGQRPFGRSIGAKKPSRKPWLRAEGALGFLVDCVSLAVVVGFCLVLLAYAGAL
jgi:hypothetical protein